MSSLLMELEATMVLTLQSNRKNNYINVCLYLCNQGNKKGSVVQSIFFMPYRQNIKATKQDNI